MSVYHMHTELIWLHGVNACRASTEVHIHPNISTAFQGKPDARYRHSQDNDGTAREGHVLSQVNGTQPHQCHHRRQHKVLWSQLLQRESLLCLLILAASLSSFQQHTKTGTNKMLHPDQRAAQVEKEWAEKKGSESNKEASVCICHSVVGEKNVV